MERIAVFVKRLRGLNDRIDSLSGKPTAHQAALSELNDEFDSFTTWAEGWINDFIWVAEMERALWESHGVMYALPWD